LRPSSPLRPGRESRDVDVAYETAQLTRNSIMQQAAISILTQANAQPQVALQLLQ
jgi:flagellin